MNGVVTHTRVPRERPPVDEYLRLQGRFRHLFQPGRDEALLADIQGRVDSYWAEVV